MGMTLFQAHRGASGLAPENTIAAFELSLTWNPDYIELDVQRSRDGHLMVIHDPFLRRTAGHPGNVADLTLAELKQLDAGGWFDPRFKGEQIPTFQETLRLLRGRVRLNVEIKYGSVMYPGIEAQMVDMVRQEGMLDDVAFSSFNWDSLVQVRQLEPRAKTQMIVSGYSSELAPLATKFGCEFLAMEWRYLTPEIIQASAEAGLKLNVWVVDEPLQMHRYIDLGIPVLTTNRPDLFDAVKRESA